MTSRYTRFAYILLAVSFLIRLAYVQFGPAMEASLYSDMKNYENIADLILSEQWRASHFFQPIGFPLLLVTLKKYTHNWIGWLECIQLLTSTWTLWFLWQTAKESLGEKIGLASLLVGTLHFPWIVFLGFALSETIFIFLLSILSWLSLKVIRLKQLKYYVLWSVVFLMAFLTKGTHVFYGPLFLLGIWLHEKTQIKKIIVISVIVGCGLITHGLFTKAKINHFQMSASAGGLNFVEGKCPLKNNADSAGYSWLSPLYHQLGMTQQKRWDRPFTNSGYYMKQGMKCIIRNPSVLIQSFEGIPYLFMGNTLWPANQLKSAGWMRLYELFYAVFSVTGLIVFFRFLNLSSQKSEDLILWCLPILSVFLCVYIFKSEIRFRIPFDVWIIPVALKGWLQLIRSKVTV